MRCARQCLQSTSQRSPTARAAAPTRGRAAQVRAMSAGAMHQVTMEQVYQHCRATCSKARDLLDSVQLPAATAADAQQHVADFEVLLEAGSVSPLTGGSMDGLMLIACSGMDMACLCMAATLHLATEVKTLKGSMEVLKGNMEVLKGKVEVLEEDVRALKLRKERERELPVLGELRAQCENKLYRMCLTVSLEPKEVAQGTLARLMVDKRLDPPLLQQCLSKWPALDWGLQALKEMGGWAVGHPQPLDMTEEKLLELVDKYIGPLVKEDVLQVVRALVDMAEVHKEPLFVNTMWQTDREFTTGSRII